MKISDFEQAFAGRKPGLLETKMESAVLIPLVETEEGLSILFEVRADDLSRQPGEICFPGGVMEPGEMHEECAVRETEEELGIPRELVRIIAPFDVLHNYTNIAIYPFLGELDAKALQHMKISKAEVKEVFTVPVDFFLDQKPYIYEYSVVAEIGSDFPYEMLDSVEKYSWRNGKCIVPIYNYKGYIIWGITGRIVYYLLENLT